MALTDIIGGSITDGVAKIIGLFKVDPTKALEKQTELAELQLQMQGKILDATTQEIQGQLKVNEVEAASKSVFVAGWRPYIGWVCGTGIAVDVIVRPLFGFVAAAVGHPLNLPPLDLATLLPLLGGMLGFGTMRSFDKSKGTDNGH